MKPSAQNEEHARQPSSKRNSWHEGRNQKHRDRSSSTVSTEASTETEHGSMTCGRPPPLSTRWRDPWVPRKLEFKGCNIDFKLKNIQGIPNCEVKAVLDDLEKMMPQEARKWIDWEQTESDHGLWSECAVC